MLLPSDVARLVLGYLQQEGLTATSRAFIFECPNLKEYAEHSSEDGIIPACVFSLFGKNLITILNEYVAVKSKETSQENQIPIVMASLWKKLDFTLNQIKSMQNSPALQMNQRLRTQHHIQSMIRQPRPISTSPSPAAGHLQLTSSMTSQCVPSPLSTPQGMLGHSTPVSYTSQYTRPSTLCLTQLGESPLQILVPDHRLNPGPLSPARRKCDSPRRRGGGQLGASGTSRSTVVSSTLIVETASEENVAENLSQKVIENAREKILNDRSLQEKLAENINKILASDISPQTSKAACSTIEPEQSIDEILGLQGEIHMTDVAIQDILAQTESDPAFQALFDLFDYGKSKSAEGDEEVDESFSTSAHESDMTGHIDSASETGTALEDSGSAGESARNLSLNTSESKNKNKSLVNHKMSQSSSTAPQPRVSKQTAAGRGPTHLKKGLVRSRVLSGNKQSTSTTKLNSKTDSRPPDQTVSSSCFTEETVVMEIDDTPDNTSENISSLVPQESSVITNRQCDLMNQSSVSNKPHPASTTEASGGNNLDMTGTSVSAIQSKAVPSVYLSEPDVDISILTPPHSSNKTSLTSTFTQHTDSTQPCVLRSVSSAAASPTLVSSAITSASSTSLDGQTKEPDPSKIMSLKIILSDEQDGQSSDVALNQAVSSITGDRIPTIFLSSPAKSPAKTLSTASTVITQEETVLAVNTLQGMEGVGSFGTPSRNILSNVQALARPVGQETGFIQLLPANSSYGPPASYFVVTDPSAAEQRSNVVLLPKTVSQGTVSSTPHVIGTPPRQRTVVSVGPNISQTYTPGSTIIISSPVQPMLQNVMVPVSVVGQNTGKLTVIPNQMLSLPCPTAVRQPAKVVSQPKLAPKEKTDTCKTVPSGPAQVSKVLPQTSQISDQPSSGTSPSHRRILRFDTSSENTTAGQSFSNLPSPPTQQNKDKRTEPKQPAVCDTSKRRIEPIRLPEGKPSVPQQKTEAHKKRSDQTAASGRTLNKTTIEPQVRDDGGTASQSAKSAPGQKQKPASSTPEEPSDERPKPADQISLQDSPGVTANKENELSGCQQDQRLPENLLPSTVKPPAPVSISSAKILCKTSPLTKQAVEMLHDIQGQTPPKKQHNSICPDLPRTPGAGRTQEEVTDGLRTPARHRHGREGESTPRCLPPPVTPDVPSCSPASEAGSENSINMAAHTLMILSRAARTGGPLKDSLRQEEVKAGKCSVPKTKKRKHVEPSPPAKKELQLSGSSSSKKKSKKQKKLLDSFPDDLDVDKFLSSLHYDE